MWVIAVGNISSGLTFYGPFETPHDASEWGDQSDDTEPWCVIYVEAPYE